MIDEALDKETEAMLESLDDSNTVGSLKNEQAARIIRRLRGEVYRQNARADRAEARIEDAGSYLWDRSWSNGVIPRALEKLCYTKARTAVKATEL